MDYLVYGGGTGMAFLPVLLNLQVNPYALVVYMLVCFFSIVQLYKKLDEKTKPFIFYLPLLFILATFVKGRRPRIGLILIMVAMFCLGILLVDDIILKNKLFKDENQKTLFRVQILLLLSVSMYMITDSIRLANLGRDATTQ